MGWFLLGLGSLTLGFAVWAVWKAFGQENIAERGENLKFAAASGIFAGVLLGVSAMYLLNVGANLSVSQADLLMRAVGAGMALMSVWVAWYGPRTSWQSYDAKFHGASSLPALQKTMTVLCVAMGVFLLATGILFLTMSHLLFTAFSVVLGAIGVAGAIVAIGTSCTAALIADKLEMDAQVAAWRRRHMVTNENAIE